MSDPAPVWTARANEPPLVELRQIQKSYGGMRALKGAHLVARGGEVVGLVGENGAGKSTLIRILAGEILRDGGEIYWRGRAARVTSRADSERLGITLIHQEPNLAPHLTVAQNIYLGHEPSKHGILDNAKEGSDARALLEKLGFPLDPKSRIGSLGPAERQQVEIARAVAHESPLVMMDEPTSSLTAREVADLFRVVRGLKAEGTAVIFVTHRLEELAQIADRVSVLRDGETVEEGPMPRRDFGELIRAMVGRELKDFFPPRAARIGAVAFGCRKHFTREPRRSRASRGLGPERGASSGAEFYRAPAHPPAGARPEGRSAEWRQSAKGSDCQMALPPGAYLHLRRADPRRGRGRQSRNLSPHE